jgi:hypothetical protein
MFAEEQTRLSRCRLLELSPLPDFAERYAQRFGIAAKVLVSIGEAKDWLGLRETLSPRDDSISRI